MHLLGRVRWRRVREEIASFLLKKKTKAVSAIETSSCIAVKQLDCESLSMCVREVGERRLNKRMITPRVSLKAHSDFEQPLKGKDM